MSSRYNSKPKILMPNSFPHNNKTINTNSCGTKSFFILPFVTPHFFGGEQRGQSTEGSAVDLLVVG